VNSISQNPGFTPPAPTLGGIPGAPAPVAAPAPAAPQVQPDSVQLGQAPPPPAAPVPQDYHTASGVQARVVRDQQNVAFAATLPAGAGGLVPIGLRLEGVSDGRQGQVQATLADNPEAKLPAAVGNDGRVYVQLEANAPLVSFDPVSLDFGLTTPLTVDPSGAQRRDFQEIVHADGSRMLIHDEQIQAGPQGAPVRTFTRIDDRSGVVKGARVTVNEGAQATPQQSTLATVGMAVLTNGLSLLMPPGGAPRYQESPLSVQRQQDGAYSVANGSLLDHAKGSVTGGLRMSSPLLNWMKGQNAQPIRLMPFSTVLAANPGAVFPGLVAALTETAPHTPPQRAPHTAPQTPPPPPQA